MTMTQLAKGLTCPNCNSVVPVREGARIAQCPSCDMRSLIQGDSGVERWQVARRVERRQAESAVKQFWSGIDRAIGLSREAKLRELFLVYIPYWRVHAFVAGWIFGRVRKDKDSTKPVEVPIFKEMTWNDAATDVSEFGVHQIEVSHRDLLPYESERLHSEAMVFEPTESPTDAMAEAEQNFSYQASETRKLKQKFFEKIHLLRSQLGIVYYPLWIGRYEYKKRNYQVVVDGVRGEALYGKAPGNILYRAAMLVGGMALGNLILVNGTILVARFALYVSDDDDGLAFLLAPLAIGIGLIIAGYRAFRYGEEVEKRQAKKAPLSSRDEEKGGLFGSGLQMLDEATGMDISSRIS